MKTKKYVWVVNGDIQSKKVFSYPAQVRLFAKERGFSIFDETLTRFDMIVYRRNNCFGEKGFYAIRHELV